MVGLGTRSRKRHDHSQRDRAVESRSQLHQNVIVRIGALVHGSQRDELATIGDGTTSNSQNEVVLRSILLQNRNSLHQSIIIGVGLDSTELSDLISLQSAHHLFIHSVLLDGSVSVTHEDLLVLGNIVGKLSNLTLSEDDTSRVLEVEVKHRHDLLKANKRKSE